jgi:hypothetical protein
MILNDVILPPDTRANQPAANTVPVGATFYVTDEFLLERSNGSTWEEYATPPGGGASSGIDFMVSHVVSYGSCFAGGTPTDYTLGTTNNLTEEGTQTGVIASANLFINYASGGVSGNSAGALTSFSLFRADLNPDFQIIFRTPSTMTDVRLHIAFISSTQTNSDDYAAHGAGFRYSTVAGDTGWTPITRNGATQSAGTAIGSAPAADTIYKLRIRTIDQGVTWKFSVNGGAEQDKTTHVPTASTTMGLYFKVITQTGSARNIGFCRAQVKYGASV